MEDGHGHWLISGDCAVPHAFPARSRAIFNENSSGRVLSAETATLVIARPEGPRQFLRVTSSVSLRRSAATVAIYECAKAVCESKLTGSNMVPEP
jgi:hypothetical protein